MDVKDKVAVVTGGARASASGCARGSPRRARTSCCRTSARRPASAQPRRSARCPSPPTSAAKRTSRTSCGHGRALRADRPVRLQRRHRHRRRHRHAHRQVAEDHRRQPDVRGLRGEVRDPAHARAGQRLPAQRRVRGRPARDPRHRLLHGDQARRDRLHRVARGDVRRSGHRRQRALPGGRPARRSSPARRTRRRARTRSPPTSSPTSSSTGSPRSAS